MNAAAFEPRARSAPNGRSAADAALGVPWCPPEDALGAVPRREPPPTVEIEQLGGDFHRHTTWSDGRASVAEMARAARGGATSIWPSATNTPAVGAVSGRHLDQVRRQGEETRRPRSSSLRSGCSAESNATSLPDGRLGTSPTTSSLSWTGPRPACTPGSECPARKINRKRAQGGLRHPAVRCLSHPTGRLINRRPENALDLERIYEVALKHGIAVEVNGLPARLDLSGEHVGDPLRAWAPICLLHGRALPGRP